VGSVLLFFPIDSPRIKGWAAFSTEKEVWLISGDSSRPDDNAKYYLGVVKSVGERVWNDGGGGEWMRYCEVEKWKEGHITTSLASSSQNDLHGEETRRCIAVDGFRTGDFALFLPVRNGVFFAAFAIDQPHYYLASSVKTEGRGYIVGKLSSVKKSAGDGREYGVREGVEFHVCDIEVI
jgi:hypothetical protein